MNCRFDTVIDRKGTNSVKYDFAKERGKKEDALPLWVADMDFQAPEAVSQALAAAVQHGVFGYSNTKEEYFNAVHQWYLQRFGWDTQRNWLVKTPGVVYAISTAIRALTQKGDAVLIQRPVYYPFSESILKNERVLINSPLVYSDGKYSMDFKDFEEKIVQNHVKLFILCSPHNPVGRVWTKDELIRVGDICLKHGVLVVSDEIHADFVYPGNKHLVFAGLKPEFAQFTITCTAPSKTFNLAGLQTSNIFITNEKIRRLFQAEIRRSGYDEPNAMGIIACQAAYEHGGEWLDELKAYLLGNVEYLRGFLQSRVPQVKLVEPQGTYLVWLDFRALGLSDRELDELVSDRAGLWLDDGTMFGPEGTGFQRVNIACPRSTLEQALERLEAAVKALD